MIRTALVLLLLLFTTAIIADDSKVPPPKGDQCVEDPEWMRSHHYETILDQRDKTVLQGVRTKQHSLKNCIECHITSNTKGQYARYSNKEEHFCATCHTYAAVKIDCFDCHADRPAIAVRQSMQQSATEVHHSVPMNANELILNTRYLLSFDEKRSP